MIWIALLFAAAGSIGGVAWLRSRRAARGAAAVTPAPKWHEQPVPPDAGWGQRAVGLLIVAAARRSAKGS